MDPDALGDALGLPPYVEESLRAWCATHPRSSSRERVTEAEEHYRRDPTYDPASDWLDEPFPEEME